jgi:hypothetical protein
MSRQQIGLFAAASMAFGPLDQIVENRFTPPEVHDYFIDRAGLCRNLSKILFIHKNYPLRLSVPDDQA